MKGAAVGTFVWDRTLYMGPWVRFKAPDDENKLGQIVKIYGFTQVEVNVFLAPYHDIDGGFPFLPEGMKERHISQQLFQSKQYFKIQTSSIKKMMQTFKFMTIIQKNLNIYRMEDVYFLRFREAEGSDSLWPYEAIPEGR
jgi:hypothetical protein